MVGGVNYATNKAIAAMARYNMDPKFDDAVTCKALPQIMQLMAMAPKDADFCNHVPTDWTDECVARQLMEKPAVEYTQLSEEDCAAGNLLWDKWAGCSTQCA